MRITISLVLALVMLLVPAFADERDDAQALEDENSEFEQQITDAQGRIDEIRNNISNLEESIKELDDEIANIESVIAGYQAQEEAVQQIIDEKDAEIKELEEEIAEKQEQIEDSEDEIDYQFELMKKRIKFMYENVNENYVEAIFSAGTFSEAIEKVQYLLEITNYDRKMMEKIQNMKQDLEDQIVEIKADEAELETQKAEQQAKIEALEELKAAEEENQALVEEAQALKVNELEEKNGELYDVEEMVSQLNAAIEANREAIDSYIAAYNERIAREEEERRLAAEEAARKAAEEGQEVPEQSYSGELGDFTWPLPGGYTEVTSWYGYRGDDDEVSQLGSGDGITYHNGIDFYAPTGTPIYSVLAGVVVAVGYNSGFGNYIIIYHGNNLYTQVHHCSSIYVSEGEEVSQGQSIGEVGATGLCTGPHLHFAVSIGSATSYVDPAPYLGLY